MEEKLHPEKSGPFFRVPGKKSHLEKSSPFRPESREEDASLDMARDIGEALDDTAAEKRNRGETRYGAFAAGN